MIVKELRIVYFFLTFGVETFFRVIIVDFQFWHLIHIIFHQHSNEQQRRETNLCQSFWGGPVERVLLEGSVHKVAEDVAPGRIRQGWRVVLNHTKLSSYSTIYRLVKNKKFLYSLNNFLSPLHHILKISYPWINNGNLTQKENICSWAMW